MRAVIFDRFGELPQVRDVPDPDCPAEGALIGVAATGLCRSDWHGWIGHDPDITLPHVPGHELAGTVLEIGSRVASWRVGQRITVPFVCACGSCRQCRAGQHQVCARQTQPGFTGWGSFAERVAIEHADVNLVEVPEDVALSTAAALGCRVATSYRAVTAHAQLAPGDWLVVHGCGGVGLSAIMIAAARGVRTIAVDVSAPALRLAAELGATSTVLAEPGTDVVGTVHEITEGGAHASIDALGSALTCRNSVFCLRPRGRHIQVGLLSGEQESAVPMSQVIARELSIHGSHGMAAHDYPPMIDDVRSGRLPIADLITGHITLDEAPTALVTMDVAPPVGVTIIEPAAAQV